jgi:hypothetical protein
MGLRGFAVFTCATLFSLSDFATAQNLVSNGGFETGDLSSWIVTTDPGNTLGPMIQTDTDPDDVHSGVGAVTFFDSDYADQLSQNISTQAGRSYSLSFFLACNPDLTPQPGDIQSFQVLWNNVPVWGPNTDGSFSYQEVNITGLTANDIMSNLSFSGQNEPGAYYLDDISISEVPEPSTWLMGLAAACWLLCRIFMMKRRRLAARPVTREGR